MMYITSASVKNYSFKRMVQMSAPWRTSSARVCILVKLWFLQTHWLEWEGSAVPQTPAQIFRCKGKFYILLMLGPHLMSLWYHTVRYEKEGTIFISECFISHFTWIGVTFVILFYTNIRGTCEIRLQNTNTLSNVYRTQDKL